jgi:hypothetical protein
MPTEHQTSTISRRRVAQGAAWAVPVIAVGAAAPNAAASPCTETHTYDWSIYTSGTYTTTINAAGATTTMTITSNQPRGNVGSPSNNLRVWNGPDGGFPSTAKYLEVALRADSTTTKFSQTVTFTFSSPVTNLTVTLADIDSSGGTSTPAFQEGVYITSAASFTTSVPSGSTLSGTGTQTDPWIAQLGYSVPATSDSGNAFAYFAGPVTSFSVTLFDVIDPISSSSGHSIDVFNMTFVGC